MPDHENLGHRKKPKVRRTLLPNAVPTIFNSSKQARIPKAKSKKASEVVAEDLTSTSQEPIDVEVELPETIPEKDPRPKEDNIVPSKKLKRPPKAKSKKVAAVVAQDPTPSPELIDLTDELPETIPAKEPRPKEGNILPSKKPQRPPKATSKKASAVVAQDPTPSQELIDVDDPENVDDLPRQIPENVNDLILPPILVKERRPKEGSKPSDELQALRADNAKLKEENNSLWSALKKVFNLDQIRVLKGKVAHPHWSHKTVERGIQFRKLMGANGYKTFRAMGYPFPSKTALEDYVRKSKGHCKKAKTMSRKKLAVLASCDQVSTVQPNPDQVPGPSTKHIICLLCGENYSTLSNAKLTFQCGPCSSKKLQDSNLP